METLVKGNARFLAKDVPGAIDLYKKAIQLNPRNPLGPYLLGEAFLATGNIGEAEASLKQAVELSDSKNQALRSHVLFLMADIYEREKKWPEAREAWQAYAEHVPNVPDGGAFPETAAARIKTIDTWVALEKTSAAVRERIANEKKDGGASPAPSAAPAPR
jgi:tetratricopeptide (TPR) repeat protein